MVRVELWTLGARLHFEYHQHTYAVNSLESKRTGVVHVMALYNITTNASDAVPCSSRVSAMLSCSGSDTVTNTETGNNMSCSSMSSRFPSSATMVATNDETAKHQAFLSHVAREVNVMSEMKSFR